MRRAAEQAAADVDAARGASEQRAELAIAEARADAAQARASSERDPDPDPDPDRGCTTHFPFPLTTDPDRGCE